MGVQVVSDVAFGNVADFAVDETRDRTEVSFSAHPHGGPEALWFCFRVEAVHAGFGHEDKPLYLILRHADTLLGATRLQNLRPVVRRAGEGWARLDAPRVLEAPDGRRSAQWVLEHPGPIMEVAFCYPYGRAEVEQLVAGSEGYWSLDTIGVSQMGRPIQRLSNAPGTKGSDRPGLYVIARQHSGETPGSWVLDGFLRRIAELGEQAPLVWAVPLVNIDGVEAGDYGKDSFPYDLNRAWSRPPMRHEVLVVAQDVVRWQYRCRPTLGLDFHAPGACEAGGIYTLVLDPDRRIDQHRDIVRWADALEEAVTQRLAAQPFTRVADWPSRWTTPCFPSFVRAELGVSALTVETPYALARETVFTTEVYREAGALMAGRVAELARRDG